ncbi:MAG TPA: DUF1289 domain-containing protein [Burkholderiaceae bacterium]|nr:DUF1289 domain-containing protein [Burkholderiaceae bacterium]
MDSRTIANNVHSALGSAENVPSPCVSVCRMDAVSGLCEGCLRTLDEIARWSTLPESSKRAVWTLIGQRVAARQETLP